MGGTSKPSLKELEERLKWFSEETTEEELHQFVRDARRAVSGTTATDQKRVELQIKALQLLWLKDGRTGAVAKAIIFNDDATWRQKYRAFRIWLGIGHPIA